jgi:hypothetical protein
MNNEWNEQRILIWGKTYPELSSKYQETVCTGGTLENGNFIRLYPIPFRYLSDDLIFTKYQWIKAKIKKSEEDPRPESYKVDPESIVVQERIPSDKFEWFQRKQHVLKNGANCFDTVEDLILQNREENTSIGFVRPHKIHNIYSEERPSEDYDTFVRKFEQNINKKKQTGYLKI